LTFKQRMARHSVGHSRLFVPSSGQIGALNAYGLFAPQRRRADRRV